MLDQPERDRERWRDAERPLLEPANDLVGREPARLGELAAELDRGIDRLGREADHQRSRERPGLRGVVRALADANAGFLEYFAPHGVLERFAGLDEAGERREALLGPGGLPAEQARIAVRDDHDHRGIDAREVLDLAIGVRAARAMARR